MAGKLGAKTLQNTDFSVALPLFKRTSFCASLSLKLRFWQILPYPSRRHRALNLALAMAHSDLESNSPPEIKEPLLKIPKLGQNGVSAAAISENPMSLLRVKKLSEKAVLPSRASPLSAGYDLSSATETKVPARGKALVPTHLSIAIPEGTYARIVTRIRDSSDFCYVCNFVERMVSK
ncbi:hypothetical protein FH972_018886 [Carpinus fangiana]|uniref:dUTP diphosphatase n=1 Tax=Carpinus fangiana TaxID=176857 RepID=A0A5N6RRZ0_9ROSI|nr:hypothetical protein FH972_018886 [Carpinus fangiana]